MRRISNSCVPLVLAAISIAIACVTTSAQTQPAGDIHSVRERALWYTGKNQKGLATLAAARALSLAEALYGPKHAEVAECLEVLTAATGDTRHLLRALAIRETSPGGVDAKVARTLLLLSYGILDKPEAEEHLKRAVTILERTGPKLQLGKTLTMLSAHYVITKRLADAEALKPRLDALAKELGR
jgi:hypothetical protein